MSFYGSQVVQYPVPMSSILSYEYVTCRSTSPPPSPWTSDPNCRQLEQVAAGAAALQQLHRSTNAITRYKPHPAPKTAPKYNNNINKRAVETKQTNNGNKFNVKITDGNKYSELVLRAPAVDSCTDFIQGAVDILNIYEDTAFEEFFLILDKEIRNYHYKGCKVSELTENSDTKSFLTRALQTIRGKPVSFIKAEINAVAHALRDETYDSSVRELLDYINSLYKNSKKKFLRVLSNLNRYRKTKSMTHNDLVQVVRNGVRTILFNHYSQLDAHTRRELIERIERFREKFKNERAPDDALTDMGADLVRPPVHQSSDVSKNVMNEYRLNVEKDSQKYLKNKRVRIISKESHDEHLEGKDIEEDVKSVESGEEATDYTEELSSQQSFDSSSNSIKLSQERHEQYNAQRYVTLYTEEISYKAKASKEIKNTGNHKSQTRPATTPRYRNKHMLFHRTNKRGMLRMNHRDDTKQHSFPDLRHDTILEPKHELRARPHSAQPRGPSQPDPIRTKSRHKNAHMYSQYDAVIDVQLANTDLLESLRMFEPVAVGSRESEKYNNSMYQRAAVEKRTRSPARYSISYESHYKKPVNDLRKSMLPPPANIGPVEQYMEYRNHSGNDTRVSDDDIIKRISALENELKDLKQIRDIRSKALKNNTDVVKLGNQIRKDMTEYKIEKLSNIDQKLEIKDVIKENNNKNNTEGYATNTETTINNKTYFKPNAISSDATDATVIENINISQVTDSAVDITNTKDLNKEVITDAATAADAAVAVDITTAMTTVSIVTGPPQETMPPAYYNYPDRRIDPFDHINDGLDLNM